MARHSRIEASVSTVLDARPRRDGGEGRDFELAAEVYNTNDARTAARAGATEIILDPFLRHPAPPLSRVQLLASELKDQGIGFRLRTPTIIRPQDRNALTKWLALDTPIETGHLGLMAEECRLGRDVVADYATNCFNEHTASLIFQQGASAVVLSVELTSEEIAEVVRPWGGTGFVAVAYGRPEGMTMEHCVLSAAFDRVPTTCRDLCVQKHPNVTLTDPTGYSFPLATDSDCRNRLLHSRPIEASTFVPRLWSGGIRGYKLIFNVPHLPVEELVRAYRRLLDVLHSGGTPPSHGPRELLSGEFTRGHYARAV
jgi:putative protease